MNSDMNGLDNVPIGCICEGIFKDDLIDEWIKCDGSELSRAKFPLLFSVIGTLYGIGDGVSSFNVPNCPTPYCIAGMPISTYIKADCR